MAGSGTVLAGKETSLATRTTFHHQDLVRNNEDESSDISPPLDGGYGWTIVVAILFLNAVTWGITLCLIDVSGFH
jgi:hypothetical protein